MSEMLTSNLKLCADLRTVAEQLDRPDGWGRAALSVRGAIDAIERTERERDTAREALRISELRVREHWPERDRLRAALEQIRVFALQETYGSSAGYKGIADRLAGDLFKVTTIAREALRGAAPAEEPALHKVDSVSPALRNAVETAVTHGGAGGTDVVTTISAPVRGTCAVHGTYGSSDPNAMCPVCSGEMPADKTTSVTSVRK